MKPTVFFPVTQDAREHYWPAEVLERLYSLARVAEPGPADEAWESCGTGVQAIVVGWGAPQLPASVWRRVPSLELISIFGGSAGYIDEPIDALRSGIVLANASPEMGEAVAESTLGLMLAAQYRLMQSNRSYQLTGNLSPVPGKHSWSLTGCTVGLIGFGHIGRMVAELLRPFQVRLLVSDPYLGPGVIEHAGGVPSDMDDLLRTSDVVSLHAGWTQETEGMIGARELDLMEPGTLVVSTARMPIFDQRALAERVLAGRLRLASDFIPYDRSVWSTEAMRACPHLIAVDHHTSVTYRSVAQMADRVVRNLEQPFAGEPPDNASDEQFGYERTAEAIRQACEEGLSAEATIDRLLEEVAVFKGDTPQSDDMACVVVRVVDAQG